jgi:hypothetical protein
MGVSSSRPRLPDVHTCNNATYADAILDRLVHNAYRLDLKGESMRSKAARRAAASAAVGEIEV